MKIRVGIFFGGSPRYRNHSVADSRRLLTFIDKARFDAVPLFVDEHRNITLLQGHDAFLFDDAPASANPLILTPDELPTYIDTAFINLYEDATWLCSQLLYLQIPNNGIDHIDNARDYCQGIDFYPVQIIQRQQWQNADKTQLLQALQQEIGFPIHIKSAGNPWFSAGATIAFGEHVEAFTEACHLALHMDIISAESWNHNSAFEQQEFARLAADPVEGLGYPILVSGNHVQHICHTPNQLLRAIQHIAANPPGADEIQLISLLGNPALHIEPAIEGIPFSCLTCRKDNDTILALHPYQMEDDKFRLLQNEHLMQAIRSRCRSLFTQLAIPTYANFSGLVTQSGQVFFYPFGNLFPIIPYGQFLQQARSLGLALSEFFTFLMHTCIRAMPAKENWLFQLEELRPKSYKTGILFPDSDPVSAHQAGLLYDFISAAADFKPVLLAWNPDGLFHVPTTQLQPNAGLVPASIQLDTLHITASFGNDQVKLEPERLEDSTIPNLIDVLIHLYHEPQPIVDDIDNTLKKLNIPSAGADNRIRALAKSQYRALEIWRLNGLKTPTFIRCHQTDFELNADAFYQHIESTLNYPFIATMPLPGYDYHSLTITNRAQLDAFTRMLFRSAGQDSKEFRKLLRLKRDDFFPMADTMLLSAMITEGHADFFALMLAGITSRRRPDGSLFYEVFNPTEVETGLPIPHELQPALLGEIQSEINKAAGVLMLEGNAVITFIIRSLPGKKPEIILLQANPCPNYDITGPFMRQALNSGYQPADIITQMLTFTLTKNISVPVYADPAPPPPAPKPVLSSTPPRLPKEQQRSATVYTDMKEPHFEGTTKRVAMYYFHGLIAFMKSAIFLRNLFVLILFGFLAVVLLQLTLNIYTRHNESLQVHDYVGMPIEEAIAKAGTRNFVMIISDSIFMVDQAPGVVLDQTPKALSRVKEQRRIYLTVSKSTPDLVTLPDLVGSYNFDQYSRKLAWVNIRANVRERQFDAKQEENTILHFYYDGQKYTEEDIRRGMKIPMGAQLDFVVTERLTGMVAIPNLVCKTYAEAMFIITNFNLNIGEVFGTNDADPGNYYIWKQDPPYDAELTLPPGRQINIYLTPERPASCEDTDY